MDPSLGHQDHLILPPPPDLFLWGYVNYKVYATPVPNINELWRRITDSVTAIPHATLHAVWREMQDRLAFAGQPMVLTSDTEVKMLS
jgi:hypothetical protein